MDLEFSEDEPELRENVRVVLAGICPPAVVRAVFDGKGDAAASGEQLVELDWPALAIAEEHGGLGLGFVEVGDRRRGARPGRRARPLPRHGHAVRAGVRELGDERAAGRVPRRRSPRASVHRHAGARRGRAVASRPRSRPTARRPASGWVLDGHEVARARRGDRRRDRGRRPRRGTAGLTAGLRGARRRRRGARAASVIDPTLPLATVVLDGVEVARRPGAARARATATPSASSTRALRGGDDGAGAVDGRDLPRDLRGDARSTPRTASSSAGRSARSRRSSTGWPTCYLAVERASSLALLRGAHDRRGRRPPRRWRPSMAKAAAGDCQRLLVARRPPAARRHRLHVGARPALPAEAGQGRRPPVRHRGRPPGRLAAAARTGAGGMRLRFDDVGRGVPRRVPRVAGRQPADARGDGGRPVGVDRPRPGVGPALDAHACSTPAGSCRAGRPSAAAATPARSRRSSTSRSWPRPRVPRTTNVQGLGIVAPSILDYGTRRPDPRLRHADPARRDDRLPRHERARRRQRPRRAVAPGPCSTATTSSINGQKVWTSGANYADFCFLFCRTDPDAPEAQGHQRSCWSTWTRPASPCGRCPRSSSPSTPTSTRCSSTTSSCRRRNLVGELNNGWAMANGSLAHERGHGVGRARVHGARGGARPPARPRRRRCSPGCPRRERAVAVDQIVQRRRSTRTAARCLGYRGFAKLVRGGTAPEQALMKLFASEARQRLRLRRRRAAGPTRADRTVARRHGDRRAAGHLARAVLPVLRQHDLGRRVGDPAQHHRRAGARPSPWLT